MEKYPIFTNMFAAELLECFETGAQNLKKFLK
jgi:hypothetical protein